LILSACSASSLPLRLAGQKQSAPARPTHPDPDRLAGLRGNGCGQARRTIADCVSQGSTEPAAVTGRQGRWRPGQSGTHSAACVTAIGERRWLNQVFMPLGYHRWRYVRANPRTPRTRIANPQDEVGNRARISQRHRHAHCRPSPVRGSPGQRRARAIRSGHAGSSQTACSMNGIRDMAPLKNMTLGGIVWGSSIL